MKIYGVATAAYQAHGQTDTENTLSITPVVYDSDLEQPGFKQAFSTPVKGTFKSDSAAGIKNTIKKFCDTVSEVAKLQEQANKDQGSSIELPIIFGFSDEFSNKHLDNFVDRLKSITGAGSSNSKIALFKACDYIRNLLKSHNISRFDLDHRIAEITPGGFARLKSIDLDAIVASKPSEMTDEVIEDIVKNSVCTIQLSEAESYKQTGTHSQTTFLLIQPKAGHQELFSHLKAISENKELRQRVAKGICEGLRFNGPFVFKTPFDINSPAFFDVVSRGIALIAAKLDPSLKGRMLGDVVYIPEVLD